MTVSGWLCQEAERVERDPATKLLAVLFTTVLWLVGPAAARGTRANNSQAKRPVTIADVIRMTKLGDWRYWWGNSSLGRVAQYSLDGTKFVIVLRKGDIEN